ncbi:MAG TPA: rhodanese-like domain-containing protein [Kamptonema sp.]|nr:rhodanese-like domain-containing protein [Kamptonema sp.]
MLVDKSKTGIARYFRPLPVIFCLSLISVSSLSAIALFNHMDLPTFIASLNAKEVTVAELQQGKLKPVILIDVRSPEEYAEDRIGQSPLVPITDIQAGFGIKQVQAIAKANVKPNQPLPTIVLYCQRGPRSIKAYHKLKKIGLNLVYLSGGIAAWRQAVPARKDAKILAPITLPIKAVTRSN